MPRRLTLNAEHLAELSATDLAEVAGGIPTQQLCTGYYPSINAPCTTVITDAIYLSIDVCQ